MYSSWVSGFVSSTFVVIEIYNNLLFASAEAGRTFANYSKENLRQISQIIAEAANHKLQHLDIGHKFLRFLPYLKD